MWISLTPSACRSASKLTVASLNSIYKRLFAAYGPQHWWPGRTRFEIVVGAILTQNVAWKNVETAIAILRRRRLLRPEVLDRLNAARIAPLIRSTGYFNQKAKKLKAFLAWFSGYGYSFKGISAIETAALRGELLSVNGIGPETADSILLYALGKKIFVVDAYTRRILSRTGHLRGDEEYHAIQRLFHARFRGDVAAYNEFHALFVRHGKEACAKIPRCDECPIARICEHAARKRGA